MTGVELGHPRRVLLFASEGTFVRPYGGKSHGGTFSSPLRFVMLSILNPVDRGASRPRCH